ncbi:NmrA family NAD(P)-binding protein [Spirosoma fluviale]|uniref:NmrA-like family protein n=1 Tax=Spirosoma fluviale TaxID=1597977 RepID=A0A286GMQ5_9BACT|nr:NmrA family NAD(P)-binding protein [Spirosoma fluviale]SOD96772.1 NmrA-like family protein [Spirosoma fluviale]
MKNSIAVAGATGDMGERIVKALLNRGANVRALVRASSNSAKITELEKMGVQVVKLNAWTVNELTEACRGVSCVVSALSGLRETVIDAQKALLDAAVAAGVPRFIPSDYSIDFTKLPAGRNRNLDLRREFHAYLDKAPIASTTIFNGPFADMITGQMPIILFKLHRVMVWGNPDQRIDFTTKDDTAAFTASAALDNSTPRFLRIAGDQLSLRELTGVVSEVTGENYSVLRLGGLGALSTLIAIARFVAPGGDDLYPAWQGMQYMRDMLDGRGKVTTIDNDRYPNMRWHTIKDVLTDFLASGKPA